MSKWNERTLSELPAIQLLKKLGYKYISPRQLERERDRLQEPVIIPRLEAAIKRINPWISDNNISKVVTQLTRVQGAGDIEINHKIHDMLIRYISVKQDLGSGLRPQTVKIIDFDNPSNNEFIVTDQYRVVGPREGIRCDVVCFINGLPIVVIEAKNPTLTGSTPEMAIKQLHRYQDSSRGAPLLFHYTHILMAINRVQAFVGTNGSPAQHFLEWKNPYPMQIPDIKRLIGRKPQSQDIAIAGILTPSHLLDIIQNFIIYEVVNGKLVKKIPRYQQYRAVNKSIRRILDYWAVDGSNTVVSGNYNINNRGESDNHDTGNITVRDIIKKRGGVIWHTQGSGKSLTMLFLAIKLRRIRELGNPTVVIVTDRVDLDKQITSTFKRCNFANPISAKSTSHLKELIGQIDHVPGQTILTTIHKFQDKNRAKVYPELALSENIIVLVDEGHRSQYSTLALNMRTAMPNATYIAFTGTPLIKKKKNISTSTFSSYIDKYTIDQAVADGATVPIYYESRLPHLHVEREAMDRMLEFEIEEYSDEDREKIKKRYATLKNILGAESRIKQVAVDLYKHFRDNIHINGFKAQVVAIDRLTAVRYKKIIDGLIKERDNIECAVLYSSSPNDDGDLLKYKTTKEEQDKLIARFKDPDDPLSIIIVVDMLLTGFDAPIEQVMYLDNVLRDHSLLQAIARVNRTYKNKNFGLIVDYVGISKYLQRALAIFDDDDVANAMVPFKEAVDNLKSAHDAVMSLFSGVRDKNDIDVCINAITVDKETTDKFITLSKKFEQALDTVLPDPIANEYKADYIFTVKLLQYLRNTGLAKVPTDFSDIAMKIKELIDEYVRTSGVQLILPPVSILSPNFNEYLDALGKTSTTRALIMGHALKSEIIEKRRENPEFYDSLSERLEEIIQRYKEQRLSEAEFIEAINPIINSMRSVRNKASSFGMDETEYAFYNTLNSAINGNNKTLDVSSKQLVKKLIPKLKELAIVDWRTKDDVQREMRKTIKIILSPHIRDKKLMEKLTIEFIELAKNHL